MEIKASKPLKQLLSANMLSGRSSKTNKKGLSGHLHQEKEHKILKHLELNQLKVKIYFFFLKNVSF